MPEPSESERPPARLRRVLHVVLGVCLLVVVAVLALALAVYLFDPLLYGAAAASPANVLADEPVVFASSTSAVGCAPNATDDASVEGYRLLGASTLEITGNVTLPDASYRVADPTVTEPTDGEYVVSVGTRPTDAPNRTCRGLARYTAKVQLPYRANDYELLVEHHGEPMKRVRTGT